MKIAAVLLCTLYFASHAVMRAHAETERSMCLEEMGLTLADLPKLIGDQSEEGIRKRGCFEACVMQKIGLMNGNAIDMQKIDEHLEKVINDAENREQIRQTVQRCAGEAADDDECLVAQKFFKCGVDHLKLRFRELFD